MFRAVFTVAVNELTPCCFIRKQQWHNGSYNHDLGLGHSCFGHPVLIEVHGV